MNSLILILTSIKTVNDALKRSVVLTGFEQYLTVAVMDLLCYKKWFSMWHASSQGSRGV